MKVHAAIEPACEQLQSCIEAYTVAEARWVQDRSDYLGVLSQANLPFQPPEHVEAELQWLRVAASNVRAKRAESVALNARMYTAGAYLVENLVAQYWVEDGDNRPQSLSLGSSDYCFETPTDTRAEVFLTKHYVVRNKRWVLVFGEDVCQMYRRYPPPDPNGTNRSHDTRLKHPSAADWAQLLNDVQAID